MLGRLSSKAAVTLDAGLRLSRVGPKSVLVMSQHICRIDTKRASRRDVARQKTNGKEHGTSQDKREGIVRGNPIKPGTNQPGENKRGDYTNAYSRQACYRGAEEDYFQHVLSLRPKSYANANLERSSRDTQSGSARDADDGQYERKQRKSREQRSKKSAAGEKRLFHGLLERLHVNQVEPLVRSLDLLSQRR